MRPLARTSGSLAAPSRGGIANQKRVLGECWSSTKSEDGTFEICVSPTLAGSVPSFGAEAIIIRDEAEVAEGIARAFAVKTRPAVVSALTSAIHMSAWRCYTRSQSIPQGTVAAAGRGYVRVTARRRQRPP